MRLVSLNKTLYYNCFSSPRGINGVPVRVEVDIVHEKVFRALLLPRLYTPQGAEKDYRNVIGPVTRALM